jgi:hypothetical protein
LRGFADLSPDIHDPPAILAASSVSLLANLRFLRDVHGQQISPLHQRTNSGDKRQHV